MGFPHKIIPNTPKLAEELCALIAKENVGAVVMGESKDFAGQDNPIAQEARTLAETLKTQAGVPVFFEPEALTSAEARRSQLREVKSRAPQERGPIDDRAAALILTSYLSRHHDA